MEVANNPEEAQKAKLEADKEMAQLRELMDEKVANAERVQKRFFISFTIELF